MPAERLTPHQRSLKRGYFGFSSAVDFITQRTGNELRPIQRPIGKQRQYSMRSSAPFTAITQMRNIPPVHLMSHLELLFIMIVVTSADKQRGQL